MIDRLERQHDRAEHGHEEEERQDQHGADDQEEPVPEEVGGVDAAAVSPPTCALTPVPSTTGGITSLRRVCTSVCGLRAWGDVVG